jgi:mRNA-degrading endonuclease toxin of MazEF toxin-antitoxin module
LSYPLCGLVYELQLAGAQATHALVITEDVWNVQRGDSVVVPLYPLPHVSPSLFLVALDNTLKANCTRVQSMSHEFLGNPVARVGGEPWNRVRIGIRKFLDIDRRISKTPVPPPANPRTDWWPRQNDVHFARNPEIQATDKLYGVISDDDWNSLTTTPNVAAVRLTSKTKPNRLRWEVSVTGGFVVTGDIYSIALADFEQKPPPKKYPARLSADEAAAIAKKQKSALTLS